CCLPTRPPTHPRSPPTSSGIRLAWAAALRHQLPAPARARPGAHHPTEGPPADRREIGTRRWSSNPPRGHGPLARQGRLGNLSCMTTDSNPAGQGSPADAADVLARRLRHDVVGALELFTVYLGERLGLYRALDRDGPA